MRMAERMHAWSVLRTIIGMLCCVLVSTLVCAEPPSFVYRADSRPPLGSAGLFNTGFLPWGNNRYLAGHELGMTCGTGGMVTGGSSDSAYVSVAAHVEQVRRFAERSFVDTHQDVWVYTIRATSDFYDALATHRAALSHPDPSISGSAGMSMLASREAMTQEGEYVVLGGIDRTLIREATRYRWNALSGRYEEVPGSRQQNYHYDASPQTHANPDPLDARIAFSMPTTPPRYPQVGQWVTMGASFLGACACMSRPHTSLLRAASEPNYNAYCEPTLRNKASSLVNLHLFQ